MAYEQIAEYVRMCLNKGYSKESIKQAVAARGYDPVIVDQIASQTNSNRVIANKVNGGSRKSVQEPLVYGKRTIIDKIKDNLLILELVVFLLVLLVGVYLYFGDQIIRFLVLQFPALLNL